MFHWAFFIFFAVLSAGEIAAELKASIINPATTLVNFYEQSFSAQTQDSAQIQEQIQEPVAPKSDFSGVLSDTLLIKVKSSAKRKIKISPKPEDTGIASLNGLNKKHGIKKFEQLAKPGPKSNKTSPLFRWYQITLNEPKKAVAKESVEFAKLREVMDTYKSDANIEAVEPDFIVSISTTPVCQAQGVSGNSACASVGMTCVSSNCGGGCPDYPAAPGSCGCTAQCTGTDTTPPAVTIILPANGATVSGTISVSASASDNVGVDYVQFYVDGILKANDFASPYSFSWNTNIEGDGIHTLAAKAYDAAGNSSASPAVNVTVGNSCVPSTCSSLGKNCGSWSDGCSGTLNCGSCSTGYACSSGVCQQTCSDTDGGLNYNTKGSTSGWDILVGYITLTDNCASATNLNEYSCSGSAIALKSYSCAYGCSDGACNATDATPPSVSASYSPSSPNITNTITFSGTASDASGIAKIEIYMNGAIKKTCSSVTSCSYAGGPYVSGDYNYEVVAYDNAIPTNKGTSGVKTFKVVGPNDPYYYSHTFLPSYYDDLWGIKRINSEAAWTKTTGSASIIVANIDTGVDRNHEDLKSNMWVNTAEIPNNAIDDDKNGYIDDYYGWDWHNNDNDPMDDAGHGTHTAGTIAAVGNNAKGVVGVNWKSRIMALKFMGANGGTTSNAIKALQYAADKGARVSSNSWGGGRWAIDIFGEYQPLNDALDYVHGKGMVIVAAAGNDNKNALGYMPASSEKVITVAASDYGDAKSSFSNWGKIDVAAPGELILSTLPNNSYNLMSGTSMATPHVAGLAALILAKNPALTNEEVRQIIYKGADDLGIAGKDDYFGYGRINAGRSVSMASARPLSPIITNPKNTSIFRNAILYIKGSVPGPNFASYKVEYKKDGGSVWTLLKSSTTQVINGTLATMDTSKIADGLYTVRLTAKNTTGKSYEFETFIIKDTTPPIVTIVDPTNGSSVPSNTQKRVWANISDGSGVLKGNLYVNNILRCSIEGAAFIFNQAFPVLWYCDWNIPSGIGIKYNLKYEAIDRAGNVGTSTVVTVTSGSPPTPTLSSSPTQTR